MRCILRAAVRLQSFIERRCAVRAFFVLCMCVLTWCGFPAYSQVPKVGETYSSLGIPVCTNETTARDIGSAYEIGGNTAAQAMTNEYIRRSQCSTLYGSVLIVAREELRTFWFRANPCTLTRLVIEEHSTKTRIVRFVFFRGHGV